LKRIIISRTDSIGDVVLTLPMAGVIKKHVPDSEILFLGRGYTKPVIEASRFIDEFVNWDTILEQSYLEQKASFRSLHADAIIHVFMVSAIANLADLADIQSRSEPHTASSHGCFVTSAYGSAENNQTSTKPN